MATRDTIDAELIRRNVPAPTLEYRFDPYGRKWRFDYAWPELRVAAEREGGTYAGKLSRHTTPLGYERDCQKYSRAAILGWAVVRFTPPMARRGDAVDLIWRAMMAKVAGRVVPQELHGGIKVVQDEGSFSGYAIKIEGSDSHIPASLFEVGLFDQLMRVQEKLDRTLDTVERMSRRIISLEKQLNEGKPVSKPKKGRVIEELDLGDVD